MIPGDALDGGREFSGRPLRPPPDHPGGQKRLHPPPGLLLRQEPPDPAQQLHEAEFAALMGKIEAILPALGKRLTKGMEPA